MAKNIRIQLFLDNKQYDAVKEAVLTRKIGFTNDSDMIRKVLYDYIEKIASLVISQVVIQQKTASLTEQNAQKNSIIEALRHEISEKNKEIDILKNNLKKHSIR